MRSICCLNINQLESTSASQLERRRSKRERRDASRQKITGLATQTERKVEGGGQGRKEKSKKSKISIVVRESVKTTKRKNTRGSQGARGQGTDDTRG